VRCVQRIGRRGLSSACIEGILASAAPYVAVMDADLQHDERLLPRMVEALRDDAYDLVVGSRYVDGGSSVGLSSASRERFSAIGTTLSRLVTKAEIADPMSGFFMLKRPVFDSAVRRLSAQGFKILLDILASANPSPRIKELPFEFRPRLHGESKLDVMVAWEFAMLLADKTIGHVVPVRFALFALIGASGVVVHMAVLWARLRLGAAFMAAQTVATMVAMTANFFLNNVFTYADRRLKGWRAVRGLLSFYAICGLGAVANIGVASYLFAQDEVWWLAGIAGILVGSVWNYAVSSVFTWKTR
jgi:dolichol-phosphate mannosyltransferase